MERRAAGRSKLIVAALLPVLAFCSCERSPAPTARFYDVQRVHIVTRGGVSYVDDQPVHGVVFMRNAKGDTVQRIPFENGREHGTAKTYYDNGQLKEVRLFVNGKKEGRHEGWYEDGKPKFAYNYKNDLYDGVLEEWYPGGKLYQRLSFRSGHEDGIQQCWYPGGTIKSNYTIKNGRRYGLLGTRNCVNVSDSLGM